MAVSINASSATVTVTGADKIIPTVTIVPSGGGNEFVVNAHLGSNFATATNSITGATAGDAWHAVGKVDVAVDDGPGGAAELARWNFGFLQFQKINALTLYYNGANRNGGGLVIQAHLPPALRAASGRDSGDKDPNPPWSRLGTAGNLTVTFPTTSGKPQRTAHPTGLGNQAVSVTDGVATAETGDQPMLLVGTQRQNTKTLSTNYLSQLVDDRQFVTVFSARDPQGVYTHLAHFAWSVVWDFNFVWADSEPRPRPGGRTRFTMGPVVLGAPPHPWVVNSMGDPAAAFKLGTSEQRAALIGAVSGSPPCRIDSEDPIGSYPDDFYTR